MHVSSAVSSESDITIRNPSESTIPVAFRYSTVPRVLSRTAPSSSRLLKSTGTRTEGFMKSTGGLGLGSTRGGQLGESAHTPLRRRFALPDCWERELDVLQRYPISFCPPNDMRISWRPSGPRPHEPSFLSPRTDSDSAHPASPPAASPRRSPPAAPPPPPRVPQRYRDLDANHGTSLDEKTTFQ
jgi:hypothetical protein